MTLKDFTTAAGIKRVIWIDDLFDPLPQDNPDVELRALATRANARGLTITLAGHVLTPNRSLDEWLVEFDEACEQGITAASIVAHLRERLTEGEATPIADYNDSAIAEIIASFGEDMVTRTGASHWQEIKSVLADAKRTLVLVDREFYVDGIEQPLGENILQDLVKTKLPTVHIVLLTRSVSDDTEHLRAELAKSLDIPLQDFVVAAKTVSDERGRTESHLCNSFQTLFTHEVCIDLARRIYRVAKTTLETTVQSLCAQSVYDLDRAVFQNSLTEGASELDVLTRIILLRQRVAVDSELGTSSEYFTLLSRLRALRAFAGPLTSTAYGDPALLAQWRRDEVVDAGARVNAAHSPLTCGDVFMRDGSSKAFVLLGQPCDMVVRPDGCRNTHEAIFVKAEKHETENTGSAHYFFPLPSFPITDDDQWRLDLRTWASVNLRLLDFCVFDDTGHVRLHLTAEPPVYLLPGWQKLLTRAKARISAQDKLPREYATLSLSEDLKQTVASRDGAVAELPYARVGRLRAPWAVAAYAAYASYQTRAAFGHDFARLSKQS